LELEYDPRALLIPVMPNLRNLTIRHVQDADDWIEELLIADDKARFPNLRHLSLSATSLISFPSLPLASLTSLDLSHNLLNEIPSLPESLVSLNLSHNLITSVRNAQLGSIRSINLSNNRIDCLAGLEATALQRIDVRKNEITEHGEIGRLAVLPHIKEVWCADNALTAEQDWRVKLGATFAAEGKDDICEPRPCPHSLPKHPAASPCHKMIPGINVVHVESSTSIAMRACRTLHQ
jgi:Leucine-rich repeat (LRR) protein